MTARAPRPRSPSAVWRSWTTPTVTGELARRREAVLLELLAALVLVGIAAQGVQWLSPPFEPEKPLFWLNWITVLATTLAFYGLLRLARRGRHRIAAWSIVALMTGLGFWLLVLDGLNEATWPFLTVLGLLLAGLLLGPRESAQVLVVQFLGIGVIWWLEHEGHGVPLVDDSDLDGITLSGLAAPALLSFVMLRACWLYTREVVTIDELVSHDPLRSPLTRLRTKTLTVREVEVVQLVAEGLSNDEIAARLFVSSRTVQSHVANARAKTDTPNRTALGVLAIREGLAALTPAADEATTPR